VKIDQGNFIDPRDLVERYDLAHHKEAANRYFSTVHPTDDVMRKPFNSPHESSYILPGVAAVIQGLSLFRGSRILDLGCGGGWLTKVFSYLGCEAYGVDIASSATELAKNAVREDPFREKISAQFAEYDGKTLPFEDEFFDGVAVFDAFHHIPNQIDVLRELHRVLKGGAAVVFHEPGPNHSRYPQSQMEMRHHGVIEQDIVMDDMAKMAREAGFNSDPELAVFMPVPMWTGLHEFDRLMDTPRFALLGTPLDRKLRRHTQRCFENLRVFRLVKPGALKRDSRSIHGLAGEMRFRGVVRDGTTARGSVTAINTGASTWLPSGSGIGSVNIGFATEIGDRVDREFRRLRFLERALEPGGQIEMAFVLEDVPEGATLTADFVSEGVAWFEQLTGKIFDVRVSD
jgi:SAM-dependent methyltransferase